MQSIFVILLPIAFIVLLYKGAIRLDEWEKLRKKKTELKMREMEAETEERIIQKQEENDSQRTTTTIVGNLSVGNGSQSTDKELLMAQVKCVQCGASIEPGSRFCRFCGTAVPDLTQKTELRVETVNKARIRREELNHELEKKKIEEETARKKAELKDQRFWGFIAVLLLLGMIYLFMKK